MYLMSLVEDKALVEASLGGRVTAGEVKAFGEELEAYLDHAELIAYNLLLDFSKASLLTGDAAQAVNAMKDRCLEAGAAKIITVTQDSDEVARQTSMRIQMVLEGREQFVADPDDAMFEAVKPNIQRKAA